MPDLEPITRDEKLWSGEDLEPITRREMYIKHLYDETQVIPDKPITREEMFILKAGEELHDVTIEQLTATENKTYSEEGVAYSPVIVNVPQTTLTTLDVTENGTYTAPSGTAYNEVEVDVPLPENAYLLKDIEGTPSDIATFTDGSALPMPKLEVAIEPIQEGSGDPSPTNIRPIIGWSAVDVTRCGKNLFDKTTATDGKYYSATVEEVNNANKGHSALIKVKSEKAYYMSGYAGTGLFTVIPLDINKKLISVWYDGASKTERFVCALPSACKYVYLNYNIEQKDAIIFAESNSAVPFTPYNGQTITIQLGDTYYGGKLDVVSGVMTVDRAYVNLGTLDWQYSSISERFYVGASDLGVKATDASTPFNAISSALTAKSYNEIEAKTVDYAIAINPNATQLFARYSSITSASDFITAMNGVQLVYELATPIEIQLTPTQVNSLEGVNNIFADCGKIINGQYFSKGGITI